MLLKKKTTIESPVEILPVASLPLVIAALFYGRTGTGKTTLASSFPKPLLLLDIREKGTDSIANVPDVHVAAIREWNEFEGMYWFLAEGNHKYQTVVVDQITQLQDLAITQAMKDDGKNPKDSISKRNWGQAAGLMKNWVLNYRDLIDKNIHIVFIAHDRTNSGGEEGSDDNQIDPSISARVMPSVASLVNGSVKVIGNTFIRESYRIEGKRKVRSVEYAMRVGPHQYFTAKIRSPVGVPVPDIIVDPSYSKIVAAITGEKPTSVTKLKRG